MISFSQDFIRLTHTCAFRCLNCKAHTQVTETELPGILSLIRKNRFFEIYPKKLTLHILGGDPIEANPIEELLTSFNKTNAHHILWTHGNHPITKWATLIPHLDQVAFYLPSTDPELFRIMTGEDRYKESLAMITYLSNKKVNLIINHPVTPDTLPLLPDTHDIARNTHSRLLLHYNPKLFTKTQIAFIHRYDWIENVMVFKNPQKNTNTFCHTVPVEALNDPLQIGKYLFIQLLRSLKKTLGI